ncbi:P-loop containing nucleoside triphosphate hydrolase protein [Salix suchowensis]|nr:P-loop containing nucleoside triphosphate hydrolase protein [Salix suchowensis]
MLSRPLALPYLGATFVADAEIENISSTKVETAQCRKLAPLTPYVVLLRAVHTSRNRRGLDIYEPCHVTGCVSVVRGHTLTQSKQMAEIPPEAQGMMGEKKGVLEDRQHTVMRPETESQRLLLTERTENTKGKSGKSVQKSSKKRWARRPKHINQNCKCSSQSYRVRSPEILTLKPGRDFLDVVQWVGQWESSRELLECLVPHKVHDYITEGICQVLDGQHLLSVVRTGGGKTGYFYGFMLVLRALSRLPHTHPMARNIPQHPKIVIIYPTKGLAEEMESTFRKLSLSAVTINEDTLAAARRRDEDLWTTVKTTSMILLSPEQLVSPRFSSLLDNKEFWNSICALGIDEMHLIHDWGLSGFRKAFTDIGLVFARLKPSTILLAVTATLLTVDIKSITDTLGLKAGTYSFMRCSNIRHDVKLWMDLSRPSVDCRGDRKTIIYGDTITLIYRLLVYFWHEVTPSIPRQIRFRMYASICDQEYNSETRRLFEVDPHCQVVLATDAAKVGNDWSAIADAIILNPKDPNDIIQKSGRVGRKHGAVRSPRDFVYFTKAQMDKAVNLSINPTGNGKKGKQVLGKMVANRRYG